VPVFLSDYAASVSRVVIIGVTSSDTDSVIDAMIFDWTGTGRNEEFSVVSTFDDIYQPIKQSAKEQEAKSKIKEIFHKGQAYKC